MSTILSEALETTKADRQKDYGSPAEHFERVAKMWNSYMYAAGLVTFEDDLLLRPHDIAAMMALFKLCRLMHNPTHRDSLVDFAGYAEAWALSEGMDS